MSNHVTSLLRRKTLGVSFTAKSVILLMGDLASDDGDGIWASKATMARELETTERTIQRTIEALSDAGFVAKVGRKKHRNGFTYEYQICVEVVESCPDNRPEPPTHGHPSPQDIDGEAQDIAPDTPSPVTHRHPTPDTPSPHGVTHRHPNQSKPSTNHPDKKEVVNVLEVWASPEAVASFIAYRRGHKSKALTLTAAKRLANNLQEIFNAGFDPSDALGLAEERGWASVQPDWYFNAKGVHRDNRPNRSQSAQRPENRPDPALEQIARLTGFSEAQGHGGG